MDGSTNAVGTTRGFRRDITPLGGLMITVSGLSPSIGFFIVGSDTLHQIGSGIVLAFIAAAVLGVAMSAVYAELGSAFPHTGGEYTMVGRVIGPMSAFSVLWLCLIGFCLAPALSGLGIAGYLKVVAPGLPVIPTAIVTVIAVTLIGILNIKLNARITGAFLAVECASLVVTAILGFTHPHRSLSSVMLHPVVAGAHGGLAGVSLTMLGLGAANAIYAFNGYGAAVLLGEEIPQARRHMGFLVFGSLAIGAVTEIGPVLAVVLGAPDLAALSASKSPISDFIRQAAGPVVADVMSLAVALAIFNSLIAVALVGGRQLYATARDGAWPQAINRALTHLHPRFGSPWIATLLIGLIGCVCCFAPLKLLVVILANGNVALYLSLCAAVMIGRRNGATVKAAYRMPLFPLAPVGAIIALAAVVWADLGDADTGQPGLLATVVMLAGGAAYYWTQLRRSDRWAHREPDEEIVVPV